MEAGLTHLKQAFTIGYCVLAVLGKSIYSKYKFQYLRRTD